MKNYVALGRVLTVLASTAAIVSGALVKVGDMVGVAAVDIPQNDSGSVHVTGVYEVPKTAGFAAAQGSKLYLDAATGSLVATATGNAFAGHAYEAAASGDTTVRVRLIG
jgi:predicted RecA/RadA family phage recombinase